MLDVHLRGAFNVTQPAWELMRDQGYGRIVNTASGAGVFGNFGQTNYGAAKMGLVGLTRVLAVEGAKNNIKANAIAPVAKTRMTEDLLGPAADKLLPELVTPLVAYLAHEDVPGDRRGVLGGRRPGGPGVHRGHQGHRRPRADAPRPSATTSTRSATRTATRCRPTSTRSSCWRSSRSADTAAAFPALLLRPPLRRGPQRVRPGDSTISSRALSSTRCRYIVNASTSERHMIA